MNSDRKQIILNLTHVCNLKCKYCYYREEMLKNPGYMRLYTLETIMKKVALSSYDNFQFTLHGGEPLTLNIQYFEKLFEIQNKYLSNKKYSNSLQTNGSLIKGSILNLIKRKSNENGSLSICISLDGNIDIHDFNRIYYNGNGSYENVIMGIKALNDSGIPFSIISVLSDRTFRYIENYYPFFKNIDGLRILNFSFCEIEGKLNLKKNNLSNILNNLFIQWVEDSSASFDILLFSSTIKNMLVGTGQRIWGSCFFSDLCFNKSTIISMSPQGIVSLCDSSTELIIGDIMSDSIDFLFSKKGSRKLYAQKEYGKRDKCYYCKWYNICHGGCPTLWKSINKYCKNINIYFENVFRYLGNNSISLNNKRVNNITKIKNPILRDALFETFTNSKY